MDWVVLVKYDTAVTMLVQRSVGQFPDSLSTLLEALHPKRGMHVGLFPDEDEVS